MGSNSEINALHRKQRLSREDETQSREVKSLQNSPEDPPAVTSMIGPHDAASLSPARRPWHDLTLPKSNEMRRSRGKRMLPRTRPTAKRALMPGSFFRARRRRSWWAVVTRSVARPPGQESVW